MKKYYLVEENDLLEMLAAQHELTALSWGGVDNWEWAGDSCEDYRKNYKQDNPDIIKFIEKKNNGEEMCDNEYPYFEDIAEYELKFYDRSE